MNEYKLGASPIVLGNLATDPGVGYNGEIYYNSTTGMFRAYSGGTWQNLVGSAGANQSLSNLTSTSINQTLFPASTSQALGGFGAPWGGVYSLSLSAVTTGLVDALDISASNFVAPDGLTYSTGIHAQETFDFVLFTNSNADTTDTGDIAIETGNQTGTSGNSGNIILRGGVSTNGTSGTIRFQNANEGTAGYVWTSTDANGSGTWSPASATGANQALSNLTATAINQSLIPDTDFTYDLGSATLRWANLYVNEVYNPLGDLILNASTHVINASSSNIQNVLDPVNPQDAATKNYVDLMGQGIAWKQPVRANADSNITLSGPQTVDGVALIAGDRVLVSGQTDPTTNGIYIVNAGAWTLAPDASTGADLVAAAVFVDEGTVYAATAFVQTAPAPITIGTTDITWAKFASVTPYSFNNGLLQTGQIVNVVAGDASLLSTPGSLVVQKSVTGAIILASDGLAWQPDGITLDINGSNQAEVKAASLTDTQISPTAAIALSKLAALTPNRVVLTDPSGVLTDNSSTTPTLVANMVRVSPDGTNFIEKQYVPSITLADNQASAIAVDASTTFAFATYAGFQADYYITDASSPTIVTMGKLSVVANSDGSGASIVNSYNDTAENGVVFTAVTNGANIELRYTTTSSGSARTMRIDIKRFSR